MEIAARHGGEIVSADSRQIYRGMDVGTAKPTRDERARVPHHLIDVADPGERYDAARYQREARAALAEIASRGLEPAETETYSNGVRKATYRDDDGNEVGFGGA